MKAIRALASCALLLSAISLLIAVALNFANIIGRYVFFSPIAAAEEVMLFFLVATVFLGHGVVGWQGKQIRMDVVLHLLPAVWRRRFDVFADVVTIVVSLALIVVGWPVIQMLAEFDERSQAADIPMVIPQALVPIGFALNAILVGARLLMEARARPQIPPAPEAF